MLTLMLLRHGKAEPGNPRIADKDRPLADRGHTDAARMGAWIVESDLVPDLIVCSTARRTRETLAQVQPVLEAKLGRALPVSFDAAVYEATTARLLTVIRRTPGTPRRLMLIGHNPGFEDLSNDLKREADAVAAERIARKYPTCGLAVLDLPIDAWAQTAPRSARLTHFLAPRYLS